MKNFFRRHPLAFEQMEQRLALSATPMSDFVLTLDGDWSGLKLQGGSVSFDQVLAAGNGSGFVDGRINRLGLGPTNGFIDIRDGEFVLTGPVFAMPDSEDPSEASDLGSFVTPIPQPQLGRDEIADGLIAVAEIFRPTKSAVSADALVAEPAAETTVARVVDDSWKSVSLARGRDVYFEVAALTDDQETSDNDDAGLASKLAPLIYQQTLLRREAERASATTSEEHANTDRQLPQLPVAPREDVRPVDAANPKASEDDAAADKTQRTVRDGELPQVDDFSQVVDPRDHVFAVWNPGDDLGDEAIPLRSESQKVHSATWPVLAALAVTGWVTRGRRVRGVLPSHRQPLPRK